MADPIEILLGMHASPDQDPAAMAEGLRGRKRLGEFLGLSTIDRVSDLGRARVNEVNRAAQRGGVLRRAAEQQQYDREQDVLDRERTIARDAENDRRWEAGMRLRRAAEARAAAAADRRGKPFSVTLADGQTRLVQQDAQGNVVDLDGNRVSAEELAGARLTPRGRGSQRASVVKKDTNGVSTQQWADGTVTFLDGTQWSEEESLRRARQSGSQRAETAGAKKEAQERAKQRAAKAAPASRESLASMQRTIGHLDTAIQAIEEGATTGPVASQLWSFTDPTIMLEGVQDKLGLERIGDYTFGSLSEAEGRWLRGTSLNLKLSEDRLLASVRHRKEGMQRAHQAELYKLEALEAGEDPDPDVIEEILYSDGYQFKDPAAGEGGYRPPAGVTPEQAKMFRSWSAEKQQRFLQRAQEVQAAGG